MGYLHKKESEVFKRALKFKLEQLILITPISFLIGPQQSGKTTLVKEIAGKNNYTYITFDDISYLSAAKNDPKGFINGLQKPIILDEVQRVPEIFLPIKQDIDENRIAGRYILTGSANPLLIPRLGDSLAGRMEILNLYPLSYGELHDKSEQFIDKIFSDKPFHDIVAISKKDLYNSIITGGYPPVQNLKDAERESWFNSYITTILYRDVQELANIEGLTEFPQLLRLLATRVGNLLNVAELSRTTQIPTSTLHRYLALLETLFMVKFQLPYNSNLGKRLVKAPKTYFFDTGLLSFLVDLNLEKALTNPNIIGGILENFVVSELYKQATWNIKRVNLFHYRTSSGVEVDIVLEDGSGNIVGIEIKNNETVTKNDFKGLLHLKEEVGEKFVKGIVLYTGSGAIPFGQNLFALPISTLWS